MSYLYGIGSNYVCFVNLFSRKISLILSIPFVGYICIPLNILFSFIVWVMKKVNFTLGQAIRPRGTNGH